MSETPLNEDEQTYMVTPYVCDEDQWKHVSMEILFDITGRPLIVSLDTENLIEVERKHLENWLRGGR